VPELDEPLEIEPAAPPARSPPQRARAGTEHDPAASAELMFDASGRILRDNIYGTIDEDVWRRDFTANALYYNIADFSVWDYVGGAQDIAARTLKLIVIRRRAFARIRCACCAARASRRSSAFSSTPRRRNPSARCAICSPVCRRRGCSMRP